MFDGSEAILPSREGEDERDGLLGDPGGRGPDGSGDPDGVEDPDGDVGVGLVGGEVGVTGAVGSAGPVSSVGESRSSASAFPHCGQKRALPFTSIPQLGHNMPFILSVRNDRVQGRWSRCPAKKEFGGTWPLSYSPSDLETQGFCSEERLMHSQLLPNYIAVWKPQEAAGA